MFKLLPAVLMGAAAASYKDCFKKTELFDVNPGLPVSGQSSNVDLLSKREVTYRLTKVKYCQDWSSSGWLTSIEFST